MAESPLIEQLTSKYKLKLKYGGFFRLIKNSSRRKYCFGSQKSIYIDTSLYNLNELIEEVTKHYPFNSGLVFTIQFIDKNANEQSFIDIDSDESFMGMLAMYENEKEVTIYMTTNNNHGTNNLLPSGEGEPIDEPHNEDDSNGCTDNEESYHIPHSSDNEDETVQYQVKTYSLNNKNTTMKVNLKFPNVISFRRALNHHALTNEFEYYIERSEPTRFTARCKQMECRWRIHASIMPDKVTFEVKSLVEPHSCTQSNMGSNKCATQGWIAEVIPDKLRSDGDVSVAELRSWLVKTYNVEPPYMRVARGKEQAYTNMYGKWEDSFMQIDDFKGELLNRNPGSVVDIDFDIKSDQKRFLRFFISLFACSKGFFAGCRPCISLDACHLKGKFNGVLAAATSVDGNNSIFPVAYGVLESENTKSWTWFLELLKKSIGVPDGLAISSDMQKGLGTAITQVYPNVEHRECIRHLYANFKKHFRGDFFASNLWGAARTYCPSEHDKLLKEISDAREAPITYLNQNHKKIWSRSKFGTISKCDYITNNVSEAFNSWIGDLRYQPVLDLLDVIRDKLMVRLYKKRKIAEKWKGTLVPKAKIYINNISKNFGEYEVRRSSDNRAEVNFKGRRWEVVLNERKCTCRVWQVKGLPCIHVSAFIGSIRDTHWDKYVVRCFTIEKFKEAYALEIAPMPGKDQWVNKAFGEKIYPPIIKRPPGRPKKKRIIPASEPKRRQQCARCGQYGHRDKTCKNPPCEGYDPYQPSTRDVERIQPVKKAMGYSGQIHVFCF
uniref:uncharacterized protein LOC122597295 n=1 Tax=Erigeron canadensis TaxID=72917 RepID=UPI001CB9701B|nr:uncharacterized protein LOC122597295 [Erigeron canadensis]